jgi:hypothetical protein
VATGRTESFAEVHPVHEIELIRPQISLWPFSNVPTLIPLLLLTHAVRNTLPEQIRESPMVKQVDYVYCDYAHVLPGRVA